MDDLASVIEQATGPAQPQSKPSNGGFDASVIADAINSNEEPKQASKMAGAPVSWNKTPEKGTFMQNFGKGVASIADTAYGVVPAVANLGTYAVSRAVSQSPEASQSLADKVSSAMDSPVGKALGITEDPAYKNEGSKQIVNFIGEYFNKGAKWISEQTGMNLNDTQNIMGSLSMAAPEAIGSLKGKAARLPNETSAVETPTQYPSGGAAGATTSQTAAMQGANPALQFAIKDAEKSGNINYDAAQRHIEADSLPVPIKLTKGQATQDVSLLSDEKNLRGQSPELAQRFNEQNDQLKQNINAIRDEAAPDVFHSNHVEAGQALIDAYKEKDVALKSGIAEKYKALSDANGGDIPLDGQTFVANANAELGKEMKGAYLPKEVQSIMNDVLSGKQKMTFENFENLRTILASDARKYERSGDGNAAHAVSIVRNSLEDMPLTPEAQNLKPLADDARSAARQRFQLLDADPAYKAAVNDKTAADDFINKHVVKAKVKDVIAMKQNLADNELAQQTIAHGTINFLKNKAGIVNDAGNFSQAGFNKGLEEVSPKLGFLVNGEVKNQLNALGNTARATQAQPTGSFVNNSNTLVGSLSGAVKNSVTEKIPYVGPMINDAFVKRAMNKKVGEILKPGAGIQK